jgi:hypothetical protein
MRYLKIKLESSHVDTIINLIELIFKQINFGVIIEKFKFYLIAVLLLIVNCTSSTTYECRIEGTDGLKVEVSEDMKTYRKVKIPETIDISYYSDDDDDDDTQFYSPFPQSDGVIFRIKVRKITTEGHVVVKIMRIEEFGIIFKDENVIDRCEISELDGPDHECFLYGIF